MKVIYAIALWSILWPEALSFGDDLEAMVARIQHTYDAVSDFKARFIQESMVKSWQKAQVQKAEGRVYFKKEGKMCWDYQHPTPQKIVSDGKTLWFYEPEEKQVTVSGVNNGLTSQIAADLLNGKADLKRDFEVTLVTSQEDVGKGEVVLQLIPRVSQPNLTKVILRLGRERFELRQTEVYDLFDNLTRITFTEIVMNSKLPESLFTFTPPKGVEIVAPPSLSLP